MRTGTIWTTPARYILRRVGVLCMVATLLAALAPSVSLLLAARDGHGWAVVCSSTGSRLVSTADEGDAGHGSHSVLSGEHCGYCLLQQHVPVLNGVTPLTVAGGQLLPTGVAWSSAYVAPQLPAPVDDTHLPRGPPVAFFA